MRDLLRIGVAATLAAWYLVTVVAQYPDDNYGKLKKLRFINGSFLIPNWKFFAPNPGTEDFVLLYRQLTRGAAEWSQWQYVVEPEPARLWHSFFSKKSRHDKGVLDIVSTLQSMVGVEGLERQVEACRRLIENTVIRITPQDGSVQKIQVLLARGKGFDPNGTPTYDYLFEPVDIRKVEY